MAADSGTFGNFARRLLWAGSVLLVTALLLLLTSFLIGRSNWGRRQILSIVLPAVQGQLTGPLHIGALDGDFTHLLVLREVELFDAEGQRAVRLPYIGLRYNILALLGHTLHLTAVDLKGAQVHARTLKDGRLNLAALTRPSNSPPATGPLPIRILVSGIDVELAVTYDSGAGAGPLAQAAAQLHLRGEVHLSPDRDLRISVDGLDIESSAPLKSRIALRGELAVGLLDAAKTLSLKDIELALATEGAEVTRLAPAAGLHGPLALEAKLAGPLTNLSTQLKLELPKGQARLQGRFGLLDPQLPWQLELALDAFEPAALRAGLPEGRIDLALRGSGRGTGGNLELQQLAVRAGKNALRLAGTVAVSDALRLRLEPLGAQADLTLQLDARDLSELGKLGGEVPPLAGALVGSVHVGLKQQSLGLAAHLRGTELRGFGSALGHLQLDAETTDLAGKLHLVADRLAVAGQRLSNLAVTAEGDRRLLRLAISGAGPEAVQLRLAAQARPELSGGSGLFALQGAQLTGLAAEVTALELSRGGAQLRLQPPAQLRLSKLNDAPVADLETLALTLGALKLRLHGHYETQGQKLRATVDASSLDVQELVRIATGAATAPKSQLALQLEVAGSVGAPTGKLHLSGSIEPQPELLPWQVVPELTATFGERRVRGELSLRAAAPPAAPAAGTPPVITAHFEAPLAKEGAVALKLDAESALEALRPLLPPALRELSGAVAAQVTLGGTLARPQAAIRITLPRWQLPPVRGAETALSVTYKDQVLATQLAGRVLALDGQPLLRAELDSQVPLRLGMGVIASQVLEELRSGAGALTLGLHELALPRLLAIATGATQGPPLQAGTAEVSLQARGPLNRPTVTVRADASGLQVSRDSGLGEAPLAAGLQLSYHEDALGLTLQVDHAGQPLVRGQAGTSVRVAELLGDVDALLARLPLRAQVDLLPTPLPPGLPLRGRIRAHLDLQGTPRQPQLTADATATELLFGEWPLGELTLHAALAGTQLVKAQLGIAQKHAGGAGSLALDAVVPLPFNPKAEALKLVLRAKDFRLDYQAQKGAHAAVGVVRGTLDSDLTVQGGTEQLLVLGGLSLRDGQLSSVAFPQLVREIAVELRAQPGGVISLEKAVAHAGQGTISAGGRMKLSAGVLKTVDLTARINNFPVAAGAVGMWLDSRVEVTGRAADDTLRVKVNIPSGTVRLPKLSSGSDSDVQALGPLEDLQFDDSAARAAAAAEAEKRSAEKAKDAPAAPPFLPARTLVTVELPPAFVISGPEVKTNIQGHTDAELNAPPAPGPIVTGDIRTLGGWVELLSRRYQLERGQISMSGEVPPNPLLNIVLSRKLDDATIYIEVGGTARRPSITFRSDPAIYDQAQVIGIVLSGSRGGSIQQQALGALSGLLVGKLKDSLGKAVPVDVIKLDVGGNDASGANQSSLEVGKYLRDNLYLSYTHRFGSPSTILRRLNNDQVSLEWYFLPDYQVNLLAGDQGVGALNLYWTKRF